MVEAEGESGMPTTVQLAASGQTGGSPLGPPCGAVAKEGWVGAAKLGTVFAIAPSLLSRLDVSSAGGWCRAELELLLRIFLLSGLDTSSTGAWCRAAVELQL
jgi:hypothetical protein